MVKNNQLANVVTEQMFEFLRDKDQMLIGENREFGLEFLLAIGDVGVDGKAKFRIARGSVLGYGYDFRGDVNGESAKDMFERAVENTRQLSSNPNFETFVDSGVVGDRYGWYITRL